MHASINCILKMALHTNYANHDSKITGNDFTCTERRPGDETNYNMQVITAHQICHCSEMHIILLDYCSSNSAVTKEYHLLKVGLNISYSSPLVMFSCFFRVSFDTVQLT